MESKLTAHKPGSLRELWTIAWPMIISAAAGSLMCFVDRLILAHYTTEALLAHAATMPWYWFFSFSFGSLISITEVFVGQYNGSRNYEKIGPVVWQMIWISLATWIVLIPISLWGTRYFLAETVRDLGAPYLSITLCFVPILLVGFNALGSFFVGRGKTRIVFSVLIGSNVLNAILAYWFVFGGFGLPSMGIRGAAYAMGLAQIASCLAFWIAFLCKQHRETYKTHQPSFSFKIAKRCLEVGGPGAISYLIMIAGWAILFQLFAKHLPHADFTAYTVAHVCYSTVWFFIEGVGKGVSAIVSNRIGERAFDCIQNTLKSVLKLQLIFIGISFIWLVLFPSPLIHLFLPSPSMEIFEKARFLLMISWVLFAVEYLSWVLYQTLVAATDIRFTTMINIGTFLLISMIPPYWIVCVKGYSVAWSLILEVITCIFRIAIFYRRYQKGAWRMRTLTSPTHV